jgi:NMD protein affecting ribosome stability and mRNA decay
MNTIICKECGDEVDEGEALNGYCDGCVDKFIKREEAAEQKPQ